MILESINTKRTFKTSYEIKFYILITIVIFIGIIIGLFYFRMAIKDKDLKENILKRFESIEKKGAESDKIVLDVLLKNAKLVIISWVLRSVYCTVLLF